MPYNTLYPETRLSLESAGVEAEYVFVGGSQTAYHDLFERLWAEGRGFINIEQDMVVRPGVVEELWACRHDWCGFAYNISTGYGSWLGCVKFSDDLVHTCPAAITDIDSLPPDGTPRRYWGRLDTRLQQVFEQRYQLRQHVHWPALWNLNPNQRPPMYNCSRCGRPIPDSAVRERPGVRFCPGGCA